MIDELRRNGPIVSGIQQYSSLINYSGGVMNGKYGIRTKGYYYVKIVGYGVEGKKPYWLAIGFFGQEWGLFFHCVILNIFKQLRRIRYDAY